MSKQTLNPELALGLPQLALKFCRDVAALFDLGRARATLATGAEVSDVRSTTVQAVDRLGRPIQERVILLVWVSATQYGVPGGTQTVTVTTGNVIETIDADKAYRILTDETGLAVVGVEVSGAGTRFVNVWVGDSYTESDALAWA